MVYIGSTTMKINDRWNYRKDKVRENSTANVHKHIRNIGIQHFKIILLHDYPCDNKAELLWKEREEMEKYDKNKLLNNKRSIITKEEKKVQKKENDTKNYELKKEYYQVKKHAYYLQNKIYLNKKGKEWRHNNLEYKRVKDKEYKDKNKEYYTEYNKQYYINNFEKNRDIKNEYNRQYRAKRKWLKLLPLYEVYKNETDLYF